MMNREQEIMEAINYSQTHAPFNRCLVRETEERREFFRFIHGELVEYDLTKFDGRPVRISKAEKQIAEEFRCFPEERE